MAVRKDLRIEILRAASVNLVTLRQGRKEQIEQTNSSQTEWEKKHPLRAQHGNKSASAIDNALPLLFRVWASLKPTRL